MTRDEFIAYYMDNCQSGQSPTMSRTEDGVFDPSYMSTAWHAIPCQCGEESCRGWAMVPELDRYHLHVARISGLPREWWARHYWIPPGAWPDGSVH